MKKINMISIMSVTLIGGGILVSLPVVLTSCSTNDGGTIDTLSKAGIKVNCDLNNKTVAQWTNGFEGITLNLDKYNKPSDWSTGWILGVGDLAHNHDETTVSFSVEGLWYIYLESIVVKNFGIPITGGYTYFGWIVVDLWYADWENTPHEVGLYSTFLTDISVLI